MAGLTAEPVVSLSLAQLVRREVERYKGYSPVAKLFSILDETNQTYAVVMREDDPATRPAYVVVMARVMGEKVIIEEDSTLDKPLVEALIHNAHIPREQIILAYAEEKVPGEQEKSE